MHQGSHGALVEAAAAGAEEECGPAALPQQVPATLFQPAAQGTGRWNTVRRHPLLATLAEHAHDPPRRVEVVDIERHELADPDAARVQELEDGNIAQRYRVALDDALLRQVEETAHIMDVEHR